VTKKSRSNPTGGAMAEIMKLSDAAFSALCKANPYGMMKLYPYQFRDWLNKQDAHTRALTFMGLAAKQQEQEAKNG
jgi:hypothetical protein